MIFVFLFTFFVNIANSQLIEPKCGVAPLCGSTFNALTVNSEFEWEFEIEALNQDQTNLLAGNVFEFSDCCLGKDTHPQSLCQTYSPSGIYERAIETKSSLCSQMDNCNDSCSNKHFILKPVFLKSLSNNKKCCPSCACYGDPVCESFGGIKESWILCDGREIQANKEDKCLFTRNQCESQLDHEGNVCSYLAEDDFGLNWNTFKKGSPCVPNEASSKSLITMYNIELEQDLNIFSLNVEQGERGTIEAVYLTLSIGLFKLSSLDCLTQEQPWQIVGDDLDGIDFNSIFKRNEIIASNNVHYKIKDPFTNIEIDLRCFSNSHKKKKEIYVPRINIEAVIDPQLESRNEQTNGFCVTGQLNYGKSTNQYSNFISDNGLCLTGHDNQAKLDVFRQICENEALTLNGRDNCVENFCRKNFFPLFKDVKECIEEFREEKNWNRAFCKAVVVTEEDVEECIEQWNELGEIETIQQYFSEKKACVSNLDVQRQRRRPNKCEQGVTVEYEEDGEWKFLFFVPNTLCANEEIVLKACDFPEVLNNKLRFVQKNSDPVCSIGNSCEAVDGFFAFIGVAESVLS